MVNLGFAFNNLEPSDMILRIEVVTRKDFVWLKSFAKRLQIPHILQAVHDLESSTKSVRVISLNISSRILASESLYFNKLFKNDTKKSEKKEATLQINASEEAPLMDLLNFMYINNLSASTPSELEDVRMIAEKLEVTSCMKYVRNLSMSLQHELYNGEPSCASMAEEVQPLKDAAKEYLIERYGDLTKSCVEAMGLPLSALEIVLGSHSLQVDSEDSLYYFIIGCARRRRPCPKRLFRFIYFPYLTISPSSLWLHETHYYLLDEMRINDGYPYGGRALERKRVYKYHPIKVVHSSGSSPLPHSVVYFNLTKQDLENLFRSKKRFSQTFFLGDEYRLGLLLMAQCNSSDHLGLCVCCSKMNAPFKIDYEFAVLMKKKKTSATEYKIMFKVDNRTLGKAGEKPVGQPNLLGIPWSDFMADSEYLVDGVLHLRVEITLNK